MSLSEEQLEKRRAMRRDYYRKNRRHILAYQASWKKENAEKVRDYYLKTWKQKLAVAEEKQKLD